MDAEGFECAFGGFGEANGRAAEGDAEVSGRLGCGGRRGRC